jgi:hypothetical protein
VRQFQLVEEPWQALVERGGAGAAGGLGERAGQPGLADTAGTCDDQVAFLGDPFSGQELLEQGFVEAAPGLPESKTLKG